MRVTLQVAPRGFGTVTTSPPGLDTNNQPQSTCNLDQSQQSCEWTYDAGTAVTLTARPNTSSGRTFVGWSTPDCPGTGTCTVTLADAAQTVVALFSPMRVGVVLSNPDAATITTSPAGAACAVALDPAPDLCREFPEGTRVTVSLSLKPGHTFGGWNPGCDPVGATSCAFTLVDEPTWIGAKFDQDPPPGLATSISVQFKLRKRGDGSGRVTASKLDCGSSCGAQYDYGTSLTLTATPDSGSEFDGWNGVCTGTATTCTIPVGPITAVDAQFSRIPPPPPSPAALKVARRAATSLTLSWTASAGATGYRVYLGAATADTSQTTATLRGLRCGHAYVVAVDAVNARGDRSGKTQTTAHTAACTVAARISKVVAPSRRALVVTLTVDRAATARVRLLAHGHAAFEHTYRIVRGRNAVHVTLPRTLASGRYTLAVAVTAPNVRPLALPPRAVRVP